VTDIAGLPDTAKSKADGRSLLPRLKDERGFKWRDAWFDTYDMIHLGNNGEQPHMRMIRTDNWKLILYQDGNGSALDDDRRHEFFDLRSDPGELNNIYAAVRSRSPRASLEKRLRKWMAEMNLD
jgi:arylsulfatase A-like enzyme